LSEAAQCMRPTSILAANYMQAEENYAGNQWQYPETTHYTLAKMNEIASASALCCVPIHWPHPRGAKWLLLCRSENKSQVAELADNARQLYVDDKLRTLQRRLSESEQALAELRRHPYVRLGAAVSRLLRRLIPVS
jgi:hypothetical protein